MKANLFLSQDSRDMPLMCFVQYWLLQLKSALVEFALEPFHPKPFFGGCVSLLFYHLFFYRHRYRWVISIIIISLTIKNYGW